MWSSANSSASAQSSLGQHGYILGVPPWSEWLNRQRWRSSNPNSRITGTSKELDEHRRVILAEIDGLRVSTMAELARLRAEIALTREAVWSSKVVAAGGRLIVGCRHLNLVFYIDPEDQLIGPRFIVDGEYEPGTTAFVLKQIGPHDTCIDVGANFGYYTCLFAHLAWRGRVLAYEPDPHMFRNLVDNIAINWCEGVVEPVNSAVGAEHGQITLHRWINRAGNTGIIAPHDEVAPGFRVNSETFDIPMVPLDSLMDRLERVDLIKIDVEGAESLVARGMAKLVARSRPVVLVEWSPYHIHACGSSVDEFAALLETWGLLVHTIDLEGSLQQIGFDQLRSLPFQNVVLAPHERLKT
jgi:FkbM family methyltransferase